MFSPYVIFHGKWWKCEVPLSKFCLRSCCPFPTTICNTFWECGELFLHHWLCCLHFSSRNIKFSKRISVTNTKRGQTNQATLKGIWEKWWAMEKKDKKRQMNCKHILQFSAQWETKELSRTLETKKSGFVPSTTNYLADLGKFLNLTLNFPIWRTVVCDTYFTVLMEKFKEIIQEKWLEHHRYLINISFLVNNNETFLFMFQWLMGIQPRP